MGTSNHIDPPFGTYALPPNREARRFNTHRMGDNRLGRWAISLARKQAIRGLREPFDVTVASGVKARLYPSTNRCEKRALCGVQIWDPNERRALENEIAKPSDRPFVFLDDQALILTSFVALWRQRRGRCSCLTVTVIAGKANYRSKAKPFLQ